MFKANKGEQNTRSPDINGFNKIYISEKREYFPNTNIDYLLVNVNKFKLSKV